MLKKVNRLSKERDLTKVFRFGKNIAEKHILLKFSSNRLNDSRFAFIVGKKVNKKAVRRNFLKRQLRAVVARLISQLKSGYDVIVLVKADFEFPYKQPEIEQELIQGMAKTGMMLKIENNSNKNN